MPRPPARLLRPLAVLALLALAGCGTPPALGPAPVPTGPAPRLLPLPDLLDAPAPEASSQSAAALAARGSALRADVLGQN